MTRLGISFVDAPGKLYITNTAVFDWSAFSDADGYVKLGLTIGDVSQLWPDTTSSSMMRVLAVAYQEEKEGENMGQGECRRGREGGRRKRSKRSKRSKEED